MIVDALTHIHPESDSFGPKYDASVEYLIENIENSPVDKAVVTAIAADTMYGTKTEYVAECCERYPDQLIGFASVHPHYDENAEEKLERYVTEMGMRGLKLHPRHQKLAVDQPEVIKVVQKAAQLGVPVAVCGSQWKNAPLRDQMPMNVDVLAKAAPEAKIIICHSGGFKFLDAFIVAVANNNVYLETSIDLEYFSNTPFEDQYIFTLKKIGARRVIFGSDHPESPSAESYARSRSILDKHGFSDEECELIFGRNILTLVGEE